MGRNVIQWMDMDMDRLDAETPTRSAGSKINDGGRSSFA